MYGPFLVALVVALVIPAAYGQDSNIALNRPTWQLGSFASGSPQLAVDGNRNPQYFDRSCTHTIDSSSQRSWWGVDLGQQFYIRHVNVTNRADCCAERLSNYIVAVSDNAPPVNNDADLDGFTKCGQYNGQPGEHSVVICGAASQGRYLYIYLPTTNLPLTLCEVEVFPDSNIALNRPTWQTSVIVNGHPYYAVDGNRNSQYFEGSCTHTSTGSNWPWWAVDLGQQFYLRHVDVTNRVDCCAERLSNYIVAVSDKAPPVNNANLNGFTKCGQYNGQPGEHSTITCSTSTKGRYIYIFLSSTVNPLTLCEVEVFGDLAARNLALNRPTFQITNGGGHSRLAVDGNSNSNYGAGSCTHTGTERFQAWWAVDLGQIYTIHHVNVTNRVDCCAERLSNYIVMVSDLEPTSRNNPLRRCGQFSGTPGEHSWVICNTSTWGRYVYVFLPRISVPLTLCEVEVYAVN